MSIAPSENYRPLAIIRCSSGMGAVVDALHLDVIGVLESQHELSHARSGADGTRSRIYLARIHRAGRRQITVG